MGGQIIGAKIKPYNQRPSGPGITPDVAAFYDWIQTSLNALIGRSFPPSNTGFPALVVPVVDPSTQQITSIGNRAQSLSTTIKAIPAATSITFYWDGTNGSTPLTIYRDDYSVIQPPKGRLTVSGLTASTTYYFYPFYDEVSQTVEFFDNARSNILSKFTVGSPAFAYAAPSILAAQSQMFREHISLASSLGAVGVATGSAPVNTTGGGGGGGAGYAGPWLQQFPF